MPKRQTKGVESVPGSTSSTADGPIARGHGTDFFNHKWYRDLGVSWIIVKAMGKMDLHYPKL